MPLYISFDQFLQARAEIRKIFSCFFLENWWHQIFIVFIMYPKIILKNLLHVFIRIYQILNAPNWNFRTQLTISYMSCFTTAKNEQQLWNEKPVLLQIFCAIYFNHLWSHHVTIIILPDINSAQSCILIWFCSVLVFFYLTSEKDFVFSG